MTSLTKYHVLCNLPPGMQVSSIGILSDHRTSAAKQYMSQVNITLGIDVRHVGVQIRNQIYIYISDQGGSVLSRKISTH